MSIPDKNKILEARERISPVVHRTPVMTSESINLEVGCSLRMKCENFQKTGSFKIRGATNAVFYHKENGNKVFATHSSGNHAQAVSYAAREAGGIAHIVMPENSVEAKKRGVKAYGGKITFCVPKEEARVSTCNAIIHKENATFISPFEDPLVIAGQASAAAEMYEDHDLDFILTPVGGGGLAAGTALSTKFFSPKTKVILGEPLNANDTAKSFSAGEVIPVKDPITVADGLKVTVGKLNFEIIKEIAEDVITVTEEEIIQAMQLVWERMKIIIEPSCAVPLAAVIKQKDRFQSKKVGIILSGGNVDFSKIPFL